MQDWLIHHKLDRKVLANLAFNLSQVEAYDAYVAHEVKATLEGIVQSVISSDQPAAQDVAQTMQKAPVAQSEEQGIFLFLQPSSGGCSWSENDFTILSNHDLRRPGLRRS